MILVAFLKVTKVDESATKMRRKCYFFGDGVFVVSFFARVYNGFRGRCADMSTKWLKAAGIRAIKTVCQTAVATIGTSMALSDVNWVMVGSASLLAGIISILTSLAGLPEVE